MALYKFVALPDFAALQPKLAEVCAQNDVSGTILLASEGINGTISGPESGMRAVLTWLKAQKPFEDLQVKESWADEPPFYRMKVRLKKEIVTLGVGDIDPASNAGTYVRPKDWNALIQRDDVIVVDTRNDYEVAIGTFEGATNPKTNSFRELPNWVDEKLKADPKTPIAMFCTGGIRCEKSTAFLRSKGYENVFHLEGGILKYLEEVPEEESLWQGECFVFDQRVSVGHGLEPGDYHLCHACRMPISETDMESEAYVAGVSCPHCIQTQTKAQRQRFEERQKQVELAQLRDEKHIAADVAAAKAAKKKLKEEEMARLAESGD
ncbi:MAG: rhodanese-related sulfurtransferase [Pseudomonadota bacterium]